MKIIITAGGTSEKIDDVRTITNSSTGSLGKAICEAFVSAAGSSEDKDSSAGSLTEVSAAGSSEDKDSSDRSLAEVVASRLRPGADAGSGSREGEGRKISKIYYLHGRRAILPQEHPLVEMIPIEGVLDLQENLKRILREERIGICIHAMAVSDYMVHRVTTLDKLLGTEDPTNAQDISGNKISSDIDDLIIHMKRSPKVISSIKEASPETILVGFKLLSGVPHEELIDVGYRLLEKNHCDFVMANDLKEIGDGLHRGYLIHRDRTYDTMDTKVEIAEMILKRTMETIEAAGNSPAPAGR